MRAVVQRVRQCTVSVDGTTVASIGKGLLVYAGVTHADTESDCRYVAEKVANLRIFPDTSDRMNLSAKDLGYEAIVVSQFTLFGDTRKGRRPSYDAAARPEQARRLYEKLIELISTHGVSAQGGKFQATMDVHYTNEGPVTILIDSQKQF